jgi:hypothetical protein
MNKKGKSEMLSLDRWKAGSYMNEKGKNEMLRGDRWRGRK